MTRPDAGHMLTDAASTCLALVTMHVVTGPFRPADVRAAAVGHAPSRHAARP